MALIIMKVEDLPSGRRARVHFGGMKLTHFTEHGDRFVEGDADELRFAEELEEPLEWPEQFEKGSRERLQAEIALKKAAEDYLLKCLADDCDHHRVDSYEICFISEELKIASKVHVYKEYTPCLSAYCVPIDEAEEAE